MGAVGVRLRVHLQQNCREPVTRLRLPSSKRMEQDQHLFCFIETGERSLQYVSGKSAQFTASQLQFRAQQAVSKQC